MVALPVDTQRHRHLTGTHEFGLVRRRRSNRRLAGQDSAGNGDTCTLQEVASRESLRLSRLVPSSSHDPLLFIKRNSKGPERARARMPGN